MQYGCDARGHFPNDRSRITNSLRTKDVQAEMRANFVYDVRSAIILIWENQSRNSFIIKIKHAFLNFPKEAENLSFILLTDTISFIECIRKHTFPHLTQRTA